MKGRGNVWRDNNGEFSRIEGRHKPLTENSYQSLSRTNEMWTFKGKEKYLKSYPRGKIHYLQMSKHQIFDSLINNKSQKKMGSNVLKIPR